MARTSVFACCYALLSAAACTDSAISPALVVGSPQIESVEIAVDGRGDLLLTASASDPAGRALLYNWGSRALSPPVLTARQIAVDGAKLAGDAVVAQLVVQDVEGRIAGAEVVSSLDGSYHAVSVPARADEPCVVIHDRCIAACAMSAPSRLLDAGCANECAVGIALCRANPS